MIKNFPYRIVTSLQSMYAGRRHCLPIEPSLACGRGVMWRLLAGPPWLLIGDLVMDGKIKAPLKIEVFKSDTNHSYEVAKNLSKKFRYTRKKCKYPCTYSNGMTGQKRMPVASTMRCRHPFMNHGGGAMIVIVASLAVAE